MCIRDRYITLQSLRFLFWITSGWSGVPLSICASPLALLSPDNHCSLMITTHAASWPLKLHHLMDNRKSVKIKENWPLVEFLPKHNTVAVYCFLLLHFIVHEHPATTWSKGGCNMRFTGRMHTVSSESKWRSTWVGSSAEWLTQNTSYQSSYISVNFLK